MWITARETLASKALPPYTCAIAISSTVTRRKTSADQSHLLVVSWVHFFFFLIVSVLLTIVVVVGISYCTSSELSDRGLTEGRPRSVASCMGRHSTGPMEKESAAICLTLPIAAMFILSVI